MLVSTEKWRISCQYRPKKQFIKALANLHIFSNRQTILNLGTLLRQVTVGPPWTSELVWEQWPSDHLQNRNSPQKSNKWLSDYLQPRNSLKKVTLEKVTSSSVLGNHCEKIHKFGLSVLLEDLNIKLDLLKLSSSLYPGDTRIWWTLITKIKHFL